MYRIEVAPGEETVFRTIEELATGIRNGLVTPRSRIFHGASQKWLPIEFHPHYKKALESLDRPKPRPGAPAAAAPPMPPVAELAPPPPRAAPTAPARQPVPAHTPSSSSWGTPKELEFIEVELPRISYPEVSTPSPVETEPVPEAAHESAPLPVARRRHGGGRPVMYAGLLLALVAGGYIAATMVMPAGAAEVAAEPVPGADVAAPAADTPVDQTSDMVEPAPAPRPVPAPVEPAPKPVASGPLPRISGPASQAWSSSAGAIASPVPTPAPSPAAAVAAGPAIEPPPVTVDLAVPSLPVSDSLAPAAGPRRDTAAMKRILKAVSGSRQ